MICLSKDYLRLLLLKLTFNDIFDLILLNKLALSKNFYIMMKYVNDGDNKDVNSENSNLKVQAICDKCLETVLLNRKVNLKLDSISYFLLLIIFNL
jgi:hypothetical protein